MMEINKNICQFNNFFNIIVCQKGKKNLNKEFYFLCFNV